MNIIHITQAAVLMATLIASTTDRSTQADNGDDADTECVVVARYDFEDGKLPPLWALSSNVVSTGERPESGKLRIERKHTYGGSRYAAAMPTDNASQMAILIRGFKTGDKPVLVIDKDHWIAFAIYSEQRSVNYRMSIWNETKRANKYIQFSVERGRWNVIQRPLCQPGQIDPGDEINRIAIASRGSVARSFIIDNIVIYRGDDTVRPEPVRRIHVTTDETENALAWPIADDNIAVRCYRVYRGTVPDFPANDDTFLGQTVEPRFRDDRLMRLADYYYTVRTEDINGNLSNPAAIIRARRDHKE